MGLFPEPTLFGVLVEYTGFPGANDPDMPQREAEAAEDFTDIPGLVFKSFIGDPTTELIAGFYVWESEEAARAFYASEQFKRGAAEFGITPKFRYFRVGAVAFPGRVLTPQGETVTAK
jgi:heme-degrading monooxygenase HmoA